jgi:hypothetical protein
VIHPQTLKPYEIHFFIGLRDFFCVYRIAFTRKFLGGTCVGVFLLLLVSFSGDLKTIDRLGHKIVKIQKIWSNIEKASVSSSLHLKE